MLQTFKSKSLIIALVLALTLGFSVVTFAQPYDIAVIIKATDSGFWQKVFTGAEAAEGKFEDVNITKHGPTSEADIGKQVAILETVITKQPDAIVIASTSSTATVPAIERAVSQGIEVITIDNKVESDAPETLLSTDNYKGGKKAAEIFVEQAKEHGKSVDSGKVGLISAMAGVQVLSTRDEGFMDGMDEVAPNLDILEPRYVNNRIPEALSAAQDIITSHGDNLVGFFADNNHTGDGVGRAISERELHDEYPVVAFDADDAEVRLLKEGAIDALIVQDPFRMGFDGVKYAVEAIEGEEIPDSIDTGTTVVTQDNVNEEEIQNLLNPEERKEAVLNE